MVFLGTDIGASGGPYKVTKGLIEEFGPDRVVDLPVAEMGALGMAVGAAISGLRPVVELMYLDFLGVALDPLLNQAAKAELMSGGQAIVPLVVRTQFGAGGRAGAQHSQSLEALVAGIPGLQVVCPSTPRDAYGLFVSAMSTRRPVVFIENRRLYPLDDPGLVVEDLVPVPMGEARTVRHGSDLTCVSYSRMVHVCAAAAETVASEGISVEVIDLRTLQPWDLGSIAASVTKTGKLLIVHEAPTAFGIGAEISAWVAEHCIYSLNGPIVRIGAPRTVVPFSPPLEDLYLVNETSVAEGMRSLAHE